MDVFGDTATPNTCSNLPWGCSVLRGAKTACRRREAGQGPRAPPGPSLLLSGDLRKPPECTCDRRSQGAGHSPLRCPGRASSVAAAEPLDLEAPSLQHRGLCTKLQGYSQWDTLRAAQRLDLKVSQRVRRDVSAFTGQLFSEQLLCAVTTRTIKNSGSDLTAHIQPLDRKSVV